MLRTARRFCLGTTVSVAALVAFAQADDLTIAALHAEKGLSGPSLRGAAFSPDGSMVTILRGQEGNARKLDLWAYDAVTGDARVLVSADDLVSGEVKLSEEEKNRRERQRIYDSGIVSYQWDSAGERLLFPLGGDIYTYELANDTPTQITATEAFETDARVSPQGAYISYVRDNELFVYDIAQSKEKQVTRGAGGTIRNAVSEFVAQEELGRYTGYWWSPDDEKIIFTQIDESPVAIAERLDFGKDGTKTIRQRYPFAGTDNVTIKLGVIKATGGRPIWVDLGSDPDIYVADVHWSRDGSQIFVERLSRDQKTLDFLSVDPKTGKSKTLFSETSDTWVNLTGGYRSLKEGGFLWTSERSGYNHIYRYGADGSEIGAVTAGNWPVGSISCVDEKEGEIIISGWQKSAIENHLFRVPMDGGEITQLTKAPGRHFGSFGKGCESYMHNFSNTNQPRQASVKSKDGEFRFWLLQNDIDANHPYTPYIDSHQDWQFGQIEADDGQMMNYRVLRPAGVAPGEKSPAIQLVYGGPGVQTVSNLWGNLYAQFLADHGYVVFRLDNRGSTNRGKKFEDILYRQMGLPEVRDQAIGTRWLIDQGFVDPDRIGVQGWSYGGYMTLMMLAQNPDLYAAGIAGAPVTKWETYDTAYTERFMGDPREVSEKYDASSVLTYVEGIKNDALLLIHGMADDNVIFQNSIDVIAALQAQGTDFQLMTYPGEKHGFRSRENRIHRDELGFNFFEQRLK